MKISPKFFALPIALTFSLSLFAQMNTTFNGKTLSRYIYLPAAEKQLLQTHVTLSFQTDFNDRLKLVGVMRSGGKYNSNWNSWPLMSANGSEDKHTFYMRNLYMSYGKENNVALGALPVTATNGMAQRTGLSGTGWVDGVNVNLKTNAGDISIVGGSLYKTDQPDLFTRDTKANFLSVRMSKKVFDKLMLEAGYERFNDLNFFKTAAKTEVEYASDKVVSIIGEMLLDHNGQIKTSVGMDLAIEKLATTLQMNYMYMSEDFSTRGTDFSGAYDNQKGHNIFIQAKTPIAKKIGLSAFTSHRFNFNPNAANSNLHELGITWVFNSKK